MILCEHGPTMLSAARSLARRALEALGHRLTETAVDARPCFSCSVCRGRWFVDDVRLNYYGAEVRCWSLEEEDGDTGRPDAPIGGCAICKHLRHLTVGDV